MSKLSINRRVLEQVEKLEIGSVFDYSQLEIEGDKVISAAKSLNRFARKVIISRLAKEKYYKPRPSRAGANQLQIDAVVTVLTTKNNQTVGYLTGLKIHEKLGLTSEDSNTIAIGTSNPRLPKKNINCREKYVKRNVDFSEYDVPLLRLVGAFRDVKTVPNTTADDVLKNVTHIMSKLDNEQILILERSINKLSSFTNETINEVLPNRKICGIL